MRHPAVIITLLLLSGRSALAATGSVCIRNDGEGTFTSGDLNLFADSDWSAGDRTGSGPSSDLAPGDGVCTTMTGLYVWNGYQYQYQFRVSFLDTDGMVYDYSPSSLRITSSSGTWYVNSTGISTTAPAESTYISIENEPPDPYTSISSYTEDEETCFVYWSGVGLSEAEDWSHNTLQRSIDGGD